MLRHVAVLPANAFQERLGNVPSTVQAGEVSDVTAKALLPSTVCTQSAKRMRGHVDFFTKLKNFDAYPKTLEDFRVRTFSGAAGNNLLAAFHLILLQSQSSVGS